MDADIVDLVIVGAGPAGLAAACEARKWGVGVTLLDEQPATGGQIYRGVDAASANRRAVLGEDYTAAETRRQQLRQVLQVGQFAAGFWRAEMIGDADAQLLVVP